VDFEQWLEAELQRPVDERGELAAGCSDGEEQHGVGPGRAQHVELATSTTNSLARTGTVTASRTRLRSSTEPPNQCGSQSTEIAAAPPAW
jgi:hypothetical protein